MVGRIVLSMRSIASLSVRQRSILSGHRLSATLDQVLQWLDGHIPMHRVVDMVLLLIPARQPQLPLQTYPFLTLDVQPK